MGEVGDEKNKNPRAIPENTYAILKCSAFNKSQKAKRKFIRASGGWAPNKTYK